MCSSGVVGSDPYLAPEVYEQQKYDSQAVDIWSLAIIFACMSLRRFPWKIPRLSDNSFKLFVAMPSPGTPHHDAIARRHSENQEKTPNTVVDEQGKDASLEQKNESTAQQADSTLQPRGDQPHQQQHHHHHHHKTEQSAAPDEKKEPLKGPWRLLRLLPRETRSIMGKMLEVNPKHRATLEVVMADPWVSQTPRCEQIDARKIINAEGHTHTLEPGTAVATPQST